MSELRGDRSPLDPSRLAAAAGPRWQVRLLESTASTNAVALAEAVAGLVVVTDHQTAGRGRLDRTWVTPRGAALTMSAVLEPALPEPRWPLIPLAAGMAVAGVVADLGVPAAVKWPNDVQVRGRKLAGILVERTGSPALAIAGIGINVDLRPEELPDFGRGEPPAGTATSLAVEGVGVSRTELFGRVLASLVSQMLCLHDPEEFLAGYRDRCATLGQEVDVHLPDGQVVRGRATGVDRHGRLLVGSGASARAVSAGDVVHVRPAG